MKELFIPYTEALELKELGFDEPCLATYHKELHTIIPIYAKYTNQDVIKAPLYSQAFKWFRDDCGLDVNYSTATPLSYFPNLTFLTEESLKYRSHTMLKFFRMNKYFNIKEEAELECLRKLIEIVKKQIDEITE